MLISFSVSISKDLFFFSSLKPGGMIVPSPHLKSRGDASPHPPPPPPAIYAPDMDH